MSGPSDKPVPFRVSYSVRVRERLVELAAEARTRGDGAEFVAALREFDHRLRVYPQFGDPLIDLLTNVGQVRLGTVPPLAMRYGVLEDRREVWVTALPVLLSKRSGE